MFDGDDDGGTEKRCTHVWGIRQSKKKKEKKKLWEFLREI